MNPLRRFQAWLLRKILADVHARIDAHNELLGGLQTQCDLAAVGRSALGCDINRIDGEIESLRAADCSLGLEVVQLKLLCTVPSVPTLRPTRKRK